MMREQQVNSKDVKMDAKKRKALESAGWRFGDYSDFLDLTPEERHEVELRGALGDAIRMRREALGLTQKQLASKLKAKQPQVSDLELGIGVSLDFMFRALFLLGGEVADVIAPKRKSRRRSLVKS